MDNKKKILVPAVKAIIQRGEKFLLIKQELPEKIVWDLPGGKVDYGENPYKTLEREVMEEIHLSIDIVKPLGFFWFFRTDGTQVICTTFLCTPKSNEIDLTKNPADENVTDYRWVTKDEFLSGDYTAAHDNDSMKKLFALL